MAYSFPDSFFAATQWVYCIDIVNTAPGGPTVGDRYLVGTAPTGVLSTFANNLVVWDGAVWKTDFAFENSRSRGWRVWIAAGRTVRVWDGAVWTIVLTLA